VFDVDLGDDAEALRIGGYAGRLPYGLIESDRQDLAEKVAMLSLP
jgi:hypothetical protein